MTKHVLPHVPVTEVMSLLQAVAASEVQPLSAVVAATNALAVRSEYAPTQCASEAEPPEPPVPGELSSPLLPQPTTRSVAAATAQASVIKRCMRLSSSEFRPLARGQRDPSQHDKSKPSPALPASPAKGSVA